MFFVIAAKCKPWALRRPANGRFEQTPITENNNAIGWHVEMYCNNDYVFYDYSQPLVYECRDDEEFKHADLGTYVPDCVGKPVDLYYHLSVLRA